MTRDDIVETEFTRLSDGNKHVFSVLRESDLLHRGYANWIREEYNLQEDPIDIVKAIVERTRN